MSVKYYKEDEVDRLYADAKAYLIRRWEPRPGYKPLILTHGEGVHFWDALGKRYLDLISRVSVVIRGEPPINERISPCVHGDYGTIAMTANMIPTVINAEPGFKTMKDLPLPHATLAHMKKYLD